MKKIILSLLLLTGLSVLKANAQMEAAQTVKWDVNKDVTVNMEADAVWKILSEPELLKKASNGYVTGIEVVDANMPISRKITFANGGSRLENVVQNEPHNKLMVMEFADTALPKGIKSAQIAIFTKAKDNQASVSWKAMFKGDSEAKKALTAQLTAEFDSYAAGLEKMTKKVIPAARMN
ncbi:MAG: SRPBCC family protein [Candidatus Pedobacter colombiensis]|uniref:SRPBCC family protein n=1 Tax=Candidatus Pedobacter colombiensis TaxID=3121371 RepID=A0AAJ5W7F0_9SPHI|nr:SRPBCC family protein [Pedobacter sp.]WEK19928.1 MAG: SRPBCC family protein [Pedobacter sp.]